jgi:DNA-binding FadR family transcriptional regulator
VRRPKLSERVANLVADDILRGGVDEGARLPTEGEMVRVYGVARTTVREALRLLESRELVAIRSGTGGGPVARRPGFAALGNALELFLQLESVTPSEVVDAWLTVDPILARLAAGRISADQLDVLAACLDAIRADPQDHAVFTRHTGRFTATVYEAAGSPVLRILVSTLHLMIDEIVPDGGHPLVTREAAVAGRQTVLDALRARDEASAQAAMTAFTEATARYYRRRLGAEISRPVRWQLRPQLP